MTLNLQTDSFDGKCVDSEALVLSSLKTNSAQFHRMWIRESRFFLSTNINGAVETDGRPQSTILILFGSTTTTQKTGSGNEVDSNSAYKRLYERPPIRLQVKMANKRNKYPDKPVADSLISSTADDDARSHNPSLDKHWLSS